MIQFYIKYRICTDNRGIYKSYYVGKFGSPITYTRWAYQFEEVDTIEAKQPLVKRFADQLQCQLPKSQRVEAMAVDYPPYEWLLAESQNLDAEIGKLSRRSNLLKQHALKARLSQDVTTDQLELD